MSRLDLTGVALWLCLLIVLGLTASAVIPPLSCLGVLPLVVLLLVRRPDDLA